MYDKRVIYGYLLNRMLHQTHKMQPRIFPNSVLSPLTMAAKAKIYATLLTSDAYAMGVEALVYSLLKVHARFPIVVLYTPQVTQQAVDRLARFFSSFTTKLSVQMTRVDDIGIPSQVTDTRAVHVAGWVNSGYTKLHIFRMEQFETIVYIDADAVVLENVDEVCFGVYWTVTCSLVFNCVGTYLFV